MQNNQASDELAVRQLFQTMLEAWGTGDAQRYAALFSVDADYIAFDGVNQKGRTAIEAAHKPLFEKWLKGSRLTGQIEHLHFLAPNVALIHASGSIIDAGRSTPAPERASSQMLVAVKEADAWQFTAFQNTRLRPINRGVRSLLAWWCTDRLWSLLGA